jgi:hypothetical protein
MTPTSRQLLVVEDSLGWSEWLSIAAAALAVVGAAVSIPLSILAHRRAGAADRRDKERHDRELAEAAASKRAELSLVPGNRGGGGGNHTLRVHVRNIGAAPARRVRVWLVDENDVAVSTIGGDDTTTIAPNDPARELIARIPKAEIEYAELQYLAWRVAWVDEREHELTTDVHP